MTSGVSRVWKTPGIPEGYSRPRKERSINPEEGDSGTLGGTKRMKERSGAKGGGGGEYRGEAENG